MNGSAAIKPIAMNSLLVALLVMFSPILAHAESLPNIVVILADDLGWRDVSYHGSEIETPSIDRIAREGIELNRFYAQPTCSPTRAALMTGKSPSRFGITLPIDKNASDGLPLDERILPQHLADLGYQPLMVGKWHLGHARPELFPHARGFEHFYGYLTGGVGYWDHNHGGGHDWQRNGETLREQGYATRLLADEAVRLLRARDSTRPTFLYLAFGAPHLPNEAPPETVARYASIEDPIRRLHAGMVSELDTAIGRVLAALQEEGILDETLVIFSSDNGGLARKGIPDPMVRLAKVARFFFDRPIPIQGLEFMVANVEDGGSDNDPLREGKMSTGEGGARVPAAIWWPGHLEGGQHDGFMSISDVLPTLLEAVGARGSIPQNLDGASQWAAIRGVGESRTPDYLITGFQGPALYRAPWKLVGGSTPRLYNVYADPTEDHDLAAAEPERVMEMLHVMESWPTGERPNNSMLRIFLDPDRFGGEEDRAPWADVARERSEGLID